MSDKKAQKANKKAQKKAAAEAEAKRKAEEEAKKKVVEESDSSSSSDSDEEPAKPAAATTTPTKVAAPAAADDDSSSSDSDDDTAMKTDSKPAAATTTTAAGDDDDSSSSDDSDEAPAEAQKQGTKRKAEETPATDAKKQKTQDGAGDSGTIVLNNLSWNSSRDTIKAFFESNGATVDSVTVPQNDRGQSKGFAFVDISSGLQSSLALSGSTLDERQIRIEMKTGGRSDHGDRPERSDRQSFSAPGDTCSVFIGNLSFESDQNSIRSAMEQFGTIVSTRVTTDRETGRSRGFGYCDFADNASALAAIAQSDVLEIDGRAVRIDAANARTERGGGDRGGRGGGRGGRGGDRGGRGGGRGFGDRGGRGGGRGGRGGDRGGRGGGRGGRGGASFQGSKVSFD